MKKVISFILILIIISETFLMALTAQADVKSGATEFVGCAVGNIAGTYLANQIAPIVSKLKNKITSLTDVPVADSITRANTETTNVQFINKAYVTDVLARCAARTILNVMVGNVFDVMRTSGRDGGVAFIENWTNFLTQAQYRGENIFRAELSTTQLCDYLNNGVKKAFGVDPERETPIEGQNTRIDSLQTFSLAAKCTMPAGFTPQKYQQDFAGNGGWDAFSRMLEPQNNAWGLAALSQDEIAKQRAVQQSADTSQAIAGTGYMGRSGDGAAGSCAVKSPVGTSCIVYNDIKTTGSYIAANLAASINAELTWITSAQGLGSIIANLTEVLLNRLLDEGNPDEGTPQVADETGGVDLNSITPSPSPTTSPSPSPSNSGGASAPADGITSIPADQTLNAGPEWISGLNTAFDSADNVYLLVYESYLGDAHKIKGQWIDNTGKSNGTPFDIASGTGPSVTYAEGDNAFLVFWTDGDMHTIKGQEISYQNPGSFNIKSAPINLFTKNWFYNSMSATYVPDKNWYLISWWNSDTNPGQTYTRTLSTDGALGGINTITEPVPSGAYDSPETTCGLAQCLIVGKYYDDSKNGAENATWGRWLDLEGKPTSAVFFIDQGGLHDGAMVTYNSADDFYLVTWSRDSGWPEATILTPNSTNANKFSTFTGDGDSGKGSQIQVYNPMFSEFDILVVGWYYDIFAVRLDSAGTPSPGRTVINEPDGLILNTITAIATDPIAGDSLAVYRYGNSMIRWKLINDPSN